MEMRINEVSARMCVRLAVAEAGDAWWRAPRCILGTGWADAKCLLPTQSGHSDGATWRPAWVERRDQDGEAASDRLLVASATKAHGWGDARAL